MTCREFADFMADYVSGELTGEARDRFERHLHVCENCVRYLSGYRTTIALGRRAFDDADGPVPGDVPDALVKAILAARR
ncbi:MAG: zf-HC2 domain-containing protein [Acidobacteriota bacterium]